MSACGMLIAMYYIDDNILKDRAMPIEEDEVVEEVVEKKKSGVFKIIIISVVVLIIIALIVGGTMYMTGSLNKLGLAGGGNASQSSSSEHNVGMAANKKANYYFAFDPPFVVNFSDGKQIRYLQVSIEIMVFDELVIEDVKKHMPIIRNNLIMMFSNLDYETLNSVAGKEKLRSESLAEIKGILKDKTGKPGVEEVYFTGFVMQ